MTVFNVTANADSFTSNAFLLTEGVITLVDAGSMAGVDEVISSYSDRLERLVITHQHGDHVGEIETVVERYEPEVYAYAEHPLRTHAVRDGDTIAIGGETFEAIFTPGHAEDHLAFVSESTIFSGDVVVHSDGAFEGGSFGRTDRPGQSRERLIDSLEVILSRLPVTIEHMFAGHGDDFHGDVRNIVETALERAKRREPKYSN